MANIKKVEFDNEISVGGEKTKELTLRAPKTGELRGIKMMDLMNLDVDSFRVLLPRLSPGFTKNDFDDLPPAALLKLQTEVILFLE